MKLLYLLLLTCLVSCTTGSHEADGGYASDSTAGNVNSVSHQPDSAGVGSMYSDTPRLTKDSGRIR